jgi:hypothetical protein
MSKRGVFGATRRLKSSMAAETVPASDTEILSMLRNEELSHHRLEKVTGDALRSVQLRREFLIEDQGVKDKLPLDGFNAAAYYDQIDGTTALAPCWFFAPGCSSSEQASELLRVSSNITMSTPSLP